MTDGLPEFKNLRVKLTANLAKKAEPADKAYEWRDTDLKGFVLRVQPSDHKSYLVEYRVNGRKGRKTIGDAKVFAFKQAKNAALSIKSAAGQGIDVVAAEKRERVETLRGFLHGPFSEYAEQHIVSHRDFLGRVRKQFNFLLDRPMVSINEVNMKRWRKKRHADGVTFDTMRKELAYLKSVLNRAVKFKIIDRNPIANYHLEQSEANPIRTNPDKVRYLERGTEDVRLREVLAARDQRLRDRRASANQWRHDRGYTLLPDVGPDDFGDHLSPIVLLSLLTGLDRGDLFDMTWDQVYLRNRQIRRARGKVRRKSDNVWTIPLASEAVEILRRWSRQTGMASGLVFPSPVTGGRLKDIKTAWNEILKSAELENFRFKDLRHTFASWLVMGGVDIYTTRDLLCHTSVKTTEIYAHLAPDHKAAAVNRVFSESGPVSATAEMDRKTGPSSG